MATPEDMPEEGSEYITERQRIAERFIALGGGSTIDMDLAKMPKLADLVTDQHRAMVKDLTASGLAQEAVARIMGISKERLQALFDFELGTGYELAHASMARSLFLKGVAGDTQAQTNWLRLHNRTNWGTVTKVEKTDKGAEQSTAEVAALQEAGTNLVNDIIKSLSTAKDLYKRPTKGQQEPAKVVESAKPKPVMAGMTRKKVKGD